jgi:O-methyltransferase
MDANLRTTARPWSLPPAVRSALLRLGAQLRDPHQALLRAAVSHLELGRWLRRHGVAVPTRVRGRHPVFDVALEHLNGTPGVLYLEFGVYRGDSMRYWAHRLSDPSAQLVGFDSFLGLPETWRADMTAGKFSTAGVLPTIDDPRVRFVPGWFEDTVPTFAMPDHAQLVINIDADLYSSTRTVLSALEPHIVEGTLLYFDELNDSRNELRALEEFLERSGRQLEVLAASHCYSHWLFRCAASPRRGR